MSSDGRGVGLAERLGIRQSPLAIEQHVPFLPLHSRERSRRDLVVVTVPPLVPAQDVGPVVPVIQLAFVRHDGEQVILEQTVREMGIVVRLGVRAHVEHRREAHRRFDFGSESVVVSEALT